MNRRPAPAAAWTLLLCAGVFAGDISPPVGPVGPAMKTLDQVEPRIPIGPDTTPGDADSVYKITQPGSYYLTETLEAQDGKHGIEISTSFVTLDLSGYTLSGLPPSGQSLSGIYVSQSGATSVTIRDGHIAAWPGRGVLASNDKQVTLEDLTVLFCASGGVNVGDDARLVRVTANFCSVEGIATGANASIQSCLASQTTGPGFYVGDGSTLDSCTARDNTDDGFSVNNHTILTNCNAFSNDVKGIDAVEACTIAACNAGLNGGHGIEVAFNCFVTGCTCNGNGTAVADGAGIRAGSDFFTIGNRIERNTVSDNDLGISSMGDSFIIANTAIDNGTSYDTTASDAVGTIIDLSAGGTITSSNPWANFSK